MKDMRKEMREQIIKFLKDNDETVVAIGFNQVGAFGRNGNISSYDTSFAFADEGKEELNFGNCRSSEELWEEAEMWNNYGVKDITLGDEICGRSEDVYGDGGYGWSSNVGYSEYLESCSDSELAELYILALC